jgi:hypothetical protein
MNPQSSKTHGKYYSMLKHLYMSDKKFHSKETYSVRNFRKQVKKISYTKLDNVCSNLKKYCIIVRQQKREGDNHISVFLKNIHLIPEDIWERMVVLYRIIWTRDSGHEFT